MGHVDAHGFVGRGELTTQLGGHDVVTLCVVEVNRHLGGAAGVAFSPQERCPERVLPRTLTRRPGRHRFRVGHHESRHVEGGGHRGGCSASRVEYVPQPRVLVSVGQAYEDGQAETGVGSTVDRLDDGREVGRDSTGREGDQGQIARIDGLMLGGPRCAATSFGVPPEQHGSAGLHSVHAGDGCPDDVEHRPPPDAASSVGVGAGQAEALTIGDDDRPAAAEGKLQEGEFALQAGREQVAGCAVASEPVDADAVREHRPRSRSTPRHGGNEDGPGDGDRSAVGRCRGVDNLRGRAGQPRHDDWPGAEHGSCAPGHRGGCVVEGVRGGGVHSAVLSSRCS